MSDLITIVIPTYNRPDNLRRCLKSVTSQSYHDFEVTVVNDSEDEQSVQEVIDEIADPRIRYLKNSRIKGANGARNTGILAAKGEFIAFLDDDDEWLTDKLLWQVEHLKSHRNQSGVFCAFEIQKFGAWQKSILDLQELQLAEVLLNTVSIGSSSSLMFRQEVFDRVGLWDEDMKRQQDKELLVRILKNEKIGYDNRIALKVYGHNDPHPAKSIAGHEEYYHKIKGYLDLLEPEVIQKFYSYNYRRMCMYRIRLGEYKEAFQLYKKALHYQKFHLRKDAKNVYYLIKKLLSPNGKVS